MIEDDEVAEGMTAVNDADILPLSARGLKTDVKEQTCRSPMSESVTTVSLAAFRACSKPSLAASLP